MKITDEKIRAALSVVKDGDKDIVSKGMVSGIAVEGGRIVFSIEIDPARGKEMEPLRQAAQAAVEKIPGVLSVIAVLTAEKSAPARPAPQHKISSNPVAPRVRHIIAVASGKGGVGKSTVSANLAAAFVQQGWKTGLLDADIYGASQPRMMGILKSGKPETGENGMIQPRVAHGLKVMSIGLFVEPDKPVVWRGPMVHGAIQQLLRDVEWGDLDILVLDMPPGTGDAQLSVAQNVPLKGAVIVSTPQDVAMSEARKGLAMFEKVNVPALGLIENMSTHVCSKCGHAEHIFGHGGVKAEAEKLGVPFLGEVPLHIDVRTAADGGTPLVLEKPDHPAARAFSEIAREITAQLVKKQVA